MSKHYKIDMEALGKARLKCCKCLIPTTNEEDKCPCIKFINTGKCICGIFIEVKKDE